MEALASEFASALSPEDLRALMARVGMRFAVTHALPRCGTLEELQCAISAVWEPADWGWVHLTQAADHLDIHHTLSPLFSAFGSEHVSWAGGFLEGAYQQWFNQAGSGQLRVSLAAPIDAWGCAHLRLAR